MHDENALSYSPRGLVNVGKRWYHQSATSLTWALQIPRIVAASTKSSVVRRSRLRATVCEEKFGVQLKDLTRRIGHIREDRNLHVNGRSTITVTGLNEGAGSVSRANRHLTS